MFENPEVAFGGTKPLLRLIETIYASVKQPELWDHVMDGISEAVHGESMTMFARLPKSQLLSMSRTDPYAWNKYVDYYASVNGLMVSCDAKFADGKVRYGDRALPDFEFERTEFYNDFFRPNNMHYSMGLKVPLDNQPAAYLTCQRPKGNGAFSETEGLVYETLLPHLQRALMLHHQMTQMEMSVIGLDAALNAYEHAVFGLDSELKVVFSNQRATEIALAGDGLCLTHGRLHCSHPAEEKMLQTLLLRAVRTTTGLALEMSSKATTSMGIERKMGERALRLTASPFCSALTGSSTRLAALVFLSDPAEVPRTRADAMQTLYALTPSEGRVADLLLQGLEVSEIGARLHITLATARFHVKRVLAKTGARKQSELMRLILSLPSI